MEDLVAPAGCGTCAATPRRSFGAAFARGDNNFDRLRLAAALTVLFSHAYALTGRAQAEPIARATGHAADGGALAVAAFFAISGFLVTRSAERRGPAEYVRARMLRIWPALVVAVVVQTFVIGLACTDLPWRLYLLHPGTWGALVTASIVVLRPDLPGVFAANPIAGAVNGSLWTLRVELACYALPLALAAAGLLRRSVLLVMAVAGLLALAVAAASSGDGAAPSPLGDPRVVAALASVWDFVCGACLYLCRDRVPTGRLPVCVAALALIAARGTPLAVLTLHVAWPYLVLAAGLAPRRARSERPRLGDISYGVYLYAFPVQQAAVAALGARAGPLVLAAVALPPVLLLGYLSHRLVEAPALRWKPGVRRRAGTP